MKDGIPERVPFIVIDHALEEANGGFAPIGGGGEWRGVFGGRDWVWGEWCVHRGLRPTSREREVGTKVT